MGKVLITGAAGFIGSHVVERLLRRGDVVVGVDNFNTYYDPAVKRRNVAAALENDSYSIHEVDICDGPAIFELFEKTMPDVVVHLAARAGVRPSLQDPNLYNRVNILGTQHILDACREVNPSHLVAASSSSVYGGITEVPFTESMDISRTISPYAATKRMNELMAHVYSHVYGLNITMLRFFTVYGPRQRPDMAIYKFTKLITDGTPVPMFGDGTTARDYTYIDDIVDGVVKAIDSPFRYEIFNLGEHHTTTLRDLIDMVARHVGKPPTIEQQPLQPGDVTITYADVDHARDLIGYQPSVGMEEGVRRFVDWFNEHSLSR
jgi:UDP-glucuronate 4-epimerase